MKLIAERTFNLLKGFGFDVSSFNRDGDLVIDPMEATRFAVESPNILVRLDPTEKYLSLKTGAPGESIDKLRPMLKELAQDYLLDFDYSVFDKQIRPKGEKVDVAKKSQEEYPMSEMKELRKLAGLEENTKDNCTACDKDMADCDCELCDDCDSKGCDNCDDGKVLKVDQTNEGKGKLPAGLQTYLDKKNGKKDDDAGKDEDKEDMNEEPSFPNFLKKPPGADLEFGQDRGEELSFDPKVLSTSTSTTAQEMKKFMRHIKTQMPTLGNLTSDPRKVEVLTKAYELYTKRVATDPVEAYHMAGTMIDNMQYEAVEELNDLRKRSGLEAISLSERLETINGMLVHTDGSPLSQAEWNHNRMQEPGAEIYSPEETPKHYKIYLDRVAKSKPSIMAQKESVGVAHPYLKDFPGWSWSKNLKPNMDAQDGFDAFVKAVTDHRGSQGTGGYTADNIAKMDVDSQGNPIKGIHHQELEATWGKGLGMHGWTILNGLLKMQDAFEVPKSNFKSFTEASLGKMTGSRKSSYQPLADSVKIIVRHNKDVNEEVRGARSRNIHSILIQRGEEKFKMAENNLQAARAMARHLHNGGETFDTIGEAITEMSKEFNKLKEFINYVKKANLVNETNEEFVSMALENIDTIKTNFKRLSGVKSYANAVETVTAYNNVEMLKDDIDLESKFTETHFDDKVANVMDTLKASASRKQSFESKITKAIELESFKGLTDLLKEDEFMAFETPNQQLGHRVSSLGHSATDETLGNYLHGISGKLNAGGQLNQFEYGAIKSCLLSAGQHNVQQSAPMTATESYEAFLDRFVD